MKSNSEEEKNLLSTSYIINQQYMKMTVNACVCVNDIYFNAFGHLSGQCRFTFCECIPTCYRQRMDTRYPSYINALLKLVCKKSVQFNFFFFDWDTFLSNFWKKKQQSLIQLSGGSLIFFAFLRTLHAWAAHDELLTWNTLYFLLNIFYFHCSSSSFLCYWWFYIIACCFYNICSFGSNLPF